MPVEKSITCLLSIPEGSKVTGTAEWVMTKAALDLLWGLLSDSCYIRGPQGLTVFPEDTEVRSFPSFNGVNHQKDLEKHK